MTGSGALEHTPLDQQVTEQDRQDKDERECNVANLGLPRHSYPLQVDALCNAPMGTLKLCLGDGEVLLLRLQSFLLILLDPFEQFDDFPVLLHDVPSFALLALRQKHRAQESPRGWKNALLLHMRPNV